MAPTIADLLASPDTIGRLDGVAERLDGGRFRFTSALGSVVWRRRAGADSARWTYEVEERSGVDLLDLHDTTRFTTLRAEHHAVERRPLHPADHGRPYAYESLSQLFDDPKVPRWLSVPAAGFPLHGNTGNHGALTSVQCRGMFVAAGAGVASNGWTDAHARLIDVAPTLLAMLGAPRVAGRASTGALRSDARLLAQDGDEIAAVLDPAAVARHVVAVVFDGGNTNLVADAVAAGEVPNLASLLARGTGLRHGIISSFPTVTLPNHVTAFTGVHPGRHGVINNEFLALDGSHVNLLDFAAMVNTYRWLSSDVETVHEAVHRWRGDAFTSASYEYADRGASWSTFGEFRERRRPFFATPDMAAASATPWAYESDDGFRFMSRIDESSLGASIEHWRGPSVTGHPLPTLQLVNLSLTDDSGHQSGPHGALARAGLIDADRRLGRLMDAVREAGVFDDTAFVVLSDHGMEQCDPELLHTHPHADLAPLHARLGVREVGDVLLHAI